MTASAVSAPCCSGAALARALCIDCSLQLLLDAKVDRAVRPPPARNVVGLRSARRGVCGIRRAQQVLDGHICSPSGEPFLDALSWDTRPGAEPRDVRGVEYERRSAAGRQKSRHKDCTGRCSPPSQHDAGSHSVKPTAKGLCQKRVSVCVCVCVVLLIPLRYQCTATYLDVDIGGSVVRRGGEGTSTLT